MDFLNCQIEILPPLFIGFNLNTLSNSLQSPLLHEATMILQSIGHAHPHNLSSALGIVFLYLIFYTSLILYFSSLLIIIGGGASSMCCSLNCSLWHLVSRSLLNTLCIIYSSGSFSWNIPKLMSFKILKGLYLFWSNFFEGLFK